MNREKLFNYSIVVLTILLLIAFFYIIKPIFLPIMWALIFTILLYPLHLRLKNIVKSKALSSFIITITTLFFIIIPLFFAGIILVNQTVSLVQNISSYISSFDISNPTYNIEKMSFFKHFEHFKFYRIIMNYLYSPDFHNAFLDFLNKIASFVGEKIKTIFFFALSFLFKTFIFLLTFFLMLKDWDKIESYMIKVAPINKKDAEKILETAYKTILGVVYGSIGTAFIQAVLSLIFYIFTIPNVAMVLSFLTFISSFLPPLGTAIIWFPMSIYFFVYQNYFLGSFLIFYGIVVIGGVDNVLRPMLMKKGIDIPYLALSLAILGGLISFGLIGIFLGPIIFALLMTTLNIFENNLR